MSKLLTLSLSEHCVVYTFSSFYIVYILDFILCFKMYLKGINLHVFFKDKTFTFVNIILVNIN